MKLKSDVDKYLEKTKRKLKYPDEMELNRRNLVCFSYSSNISANLYGGNFLTGLLLLLNADDAFMGTLAMINILVGIVPVFSALLLSGFKNRKRALILLRLSANIINIAAVGGAALMPVSDGTKLTVILALSFFANFILNLIGPGIAVWHIKLIPEDMRAKYFSFINTTAGALAYGVILGASAILDRYKQKGHELEANITFRVAALLFIGLEVFFLFKIKDYPESRTGNGFSLLAIFTKAMKSGKYLYSVAVGCLYGFFINIPGPYFTIYLLRDLGFKYSYISLMTFLYLPFMIVMMPVWSSFIRRRSWYKALLLSLVLYAPVYFIHPFTTLNTVFIYPLGALLSYIALPGLSLVFSNNAYHNISPTDQTELVGFYTTMANLFALAGVMFGKWFVGYTADMQFDLFGVTITSKQSVMFFAGAGLYIVAFVVGLINKRMAKEGESV